VTDSPVRRRIQAARRLPSAPRLGDDVLMEAVPPLRRAVVSEYRRVVRPPWEIPTALVTNGALMVAAWFLLPPRAHTFLFSLNGPLAFPVILASWMLADTPATNVMGSSPALALSVLRDQAAYWRWLAARCIVIGSLIGVACAAGVMYVGVGHYPWSEIVWACALVALLPVGVLPVAAWLGIVFPYHPRSLRWRWQHRRAWPTHLRWLVLAFAPFFYVPLIGLAILSPGVQLARSIRLAGQRLTPAQFGISAAVVCATAVVAAAIGLWVARRLLAWRTTHLAAYLANTDKG
jgi:hypothetical protein